MKKLWGMVGLLKPGMYQVRCGIHPKMKLLEVTVPSLGAK